MCLQWNPYYEKSKNKVHFVTCGVKNLDFWTMEESGRLVSQKAIFGNAKIITFLSAAFIPDDGNVVVGTSSGGIYVFNGRDLAYEINPSGGTNDPSGKAIAHGGPVYAMTNLLANNAPAPIISGGKDGKVILWKGLRSAKAVLGKDSCEVVDVVAIAKEYITSRATMVKNGAGASEEAQKGRPAAVRSVHMSDDGRRLLVGTQGSDVYELVLNGPGQWGIEKDKPPLVRGHFKVSLDFY